MGLLAPLIQSDFQFNVKCLHTCRQGPSAVNFTGLTHYPNWAFVVGAPIVLIAIGVHIVVLATRMQHKACWCLLAMPVAVSYQIYIVLHSTRTQRAIALYMWLQGFPLCFLTLKIWPLDLLQQRLSVILLLEDLNLPERRPQ